MVAIRYSQWSGIDRSGSSTDLHKIKRGIEGLLNTKAKAVTLQTNANADPFRIDRRKGHSLSIAGLFLLNQPGMVCRPSRFIFCYPCIGCNSDYPKEIAMPRIADYSIIHNGVLDNALGQTDAI